MPRWLTAILTILAAATLVTLGFGDPRGGSVSLVLVALGGIIAGVGLGSDARRLYASTREGWPLFRERLARLGPTLARKWEDLKIGIREAPPPRQRLALFRATVAWRWDLLRTRMREAPSFKQRLVRFQAYLALRWQGLRARVRPVAAVRHRLHRVKSALAWKWAGVLVRVEAAPSLKERACRFRAAWVRHWEALRARAKAMRSVIARLGPLAGAVARRWQGLRARISAVWGTTGGLTQLWQRLAFWIRRRELSPPAPRVLKTWSGRSDFQYEGSVTEGTLIRYGRDHGREQSVSAAQFEALLAHFRGQVADMGTARADPDEDSLSNWLREQVTRTTIASHVGAILVSEGYAERGPTASQIRFLS